MQMRKEDNKIAMQVLEDAKKEENADYKNLKTMFESEPDFKEFDNQSMFFWDFKKENIRKHGGLMNGEKMMDESILLMSYTKQKDSDKYVPKAFRCVTNDKVV